MSIFHLKGKKHRENSLRGIRKAARARRRRFGRFVRRWNEIDIDGLITKDGVEIGCHWPHPLQRDDFRDPQHKIGLHANVRSLTWAEVARLRTPDGYHISTLDALMRECARLGIGMRIEPKGDPRFRELERWHSIKARADKYGCRLPSSCR
jgi:glycerophosphoryl diester phosphodiesterase